MKPASPSSICFTGRHQLYRLYDADNNLLYVGITSNVGDRFAQHSHERTWWPQVDRCQVELFPDRLSLEAGERLAILKEHPRYNVMYNEFPVAPPEREAIIKLLPVASEDLERLRELGERAKKLRAEATRTIAERDALVYKILASRECTQAELSRQLELTRESVRRIYDTEALQRATEGAHEAEA